MDAAQDGGKGCVMPVYFIRADAVVKIGHSNDPWQRLVSRST